VRIRRHQAGLPDLMRALLVGVRNPGQPQVGQAAKVGRGGPGVAVQDHRSGGRHQLSSGAWRARAVGSAMDMTSTTTSTACHCQVIQRSADQWDTTPCSGVRSHAGTCASNRAREPVPGSRRPGDSALASQLARIAFRSAELRGPGGPAVNLAGCTEDHWRGVLDGPAHRVSGTVAVMDLGERPAGRDELAVRAGGHVAARQHAGKQVRGRLELQGQDVGESVFVGFDAGVGMVGDQPAPHGAVLLDVRAVEGVDPAKITYVR
jgi:hypothetical protein